MWGHCLPDQSLVKGCIHLPKLDAAAAFDLLLHADAMRALLPSTVRATARHSSDDPLNEFWQLTLHLPYSWHARDFSVWRAVHRDDMRGEYLLAFRNGPATGQSASRLASRPGALIGHSAGLRTRVVAICTCPRLDAASHHHGEQSRLHDRGHRH